jgi:mono/diheme cytochrome c family protein
LAGGCGFVLARRDRATAPACGGELTMGNTVAAWRHVALAMIVTGSTSAASAQSSDDSFMSSRRFMQRDGEVIYRTVCQSCHMAAAQGAVGAGAYPALANDPKLAAAGYSVLVVVNGSKDMAPFGALLDDEQVAAVVNYVRSHFGNSYPDTVSSVDVKSARP